MKKHRIIIAGSRTCPERSTELLWDITRHFESINYNFGEFEVVSGGAKGADKLGEWIASIWEVPVKQFLPDYQQHGKRAPLIRNTQMAEYGNDLIVIWDGKSPGTYHMIQEAKKMGIPVKIIKI